MATPRRAKPPPSRIVIEDVTPTLCGGRFPLKRVVGEPITVGATVFADGHDDLLVFVGLSGVGTGWAVVSPMACTSAGLDRWEGTIIPAETGDQRFFVSAQIDVWGSWVSDAQRKIEAGAPDGEVQLELLVGAALAQRLARRAPADHHKGVLRRAATALKAGRVEPLGDRGVAEAARTGLDLAAASRSEPHPVLVERERALFSTWYELFPRSWSATPGIHGTFADVEAQLGYVADLGFDVLYLPPIHPIGASFRKGTNNTDSASHGDPGSPWAIGNVAEPGDGPDGGGHCSIHAALGTATDFRRLVNTAKANGIEVALDYALQCSPDHPWVRDHPDWFRHRPDGSIRYAENPPKKYQDVYPLDFACADWRRLWEACLGIVAHWLGEGVTIFRVDNPHTKPFAFWEWLIAEVRRDHPHTIFLSEAFTRPAVMHRLTTIGFTSSYSYFPWRRSKQELIDYFVELASAPSVDRFRPSAWPNTPDILSEQMWGAPRELFAIRYLLAATLCPSVGIYGPAFELCDNAPSASGNEEYARSEKYEVKEWDRADPWSIAPLIGEVNGIRHEHLALHTLRTLRFHHCDNDALLVFSKTAHLGPSLRPSVDPSRPHDAPILVVVNLDPVGTQSGIVDLDIGALGLDGNQPYEAHDLISDRTFTWNGPSNFVELRPHEQPGHIFRITQP